MNHFEHRDGILYAEDVPVPEIAKAVFDQAYDDEQSALDRLERSDVDGLRREGAPSGLGEFMDALATRGLDAWSQG